MERRFFTSDFFHEWSPNGSLTRYLNAFRGAKHGFVLLCIKKESSLPVFFQRGVKMKPMKFRNNLEINRSLPFRGPKKSRLSGTPPPFPMVLVMDVARIKIITFRAIYDKNNRYINSYFHKTFLNFFFSSHVLSLSFLSSFTLI